MNAENFLKNRKSVREFKKGSLTHKDLDYVDAVLDEVNEESLDDILFKLYENGEILAENLSGQGGYAGIMIKAPHYIAFGLRDVNKESLIYGAYYMEKIVTKLSAEDIATCWVSLHHVPKDVREELFGADLGQVDFVLAIGRAKGKSIFEEKVFSERKPIHEVVFDGEWGRGIDDFELQARGLDKVFNYVRYAPSNGNEQPWRYLVTAREVQLYVDKIAEDPSKLIDAGIAMYYFEQLASRVTGGNKWELTDFDSAPKEGSFTNIATFQL